MQSDKQSVINLFSLNSLKSHSTASKSKCKPKPKPLSTVYIIICKQAKRVYVGSGQLDDKGKCNRLAYHRSRLSKNSHPSKAMQSDYLLYPDSFSFKMIEQCPTEEARGREQLAMLRIKQDGKYQLYNTNNSFKF
jgi:hypothetical protein